MLLFTLIWWALAIGATWQASRAWGTAPAIGTFIGLYLCGALIPVIGGALSAVGAVAIGARAESAQQKQLAVYSH